MEHNYIDFDILILLLIADSGSGIDSFLQYVNKFNLLSIYSFYFYQTIQERFESSFQINLKPMKTI